MKINFREPSTKRGIVMIITGGVVLYQTFWGSGPVNIDALSARIDWWLGIGMTIVGMLGFLPDRDSEKRTRATDLPNIELQGRSESVTEDRRPAAVDQPERFGSADVGVRLDVSPGHRPATEGDDRRATSSDESGRSGWNG